MWVGYLGQEDSLKKEMTIHSSILAWKIPRTEEPGELQSMGLQRVRHNCAHTRAFSYSRHLMWGTEPGYLKDEPVWDAVALVTCSARVFQYL